MTTRIQPGRIFFIMVIILGLSLLGLIACGGKGNPEADSKPAEETAAPSAQKEDAPSDKEKSSSIPADWKTHKYQEWSYSFPNDWNSDGDRGIWFPGEDNLNMGRPALSVHSGGIPLMPNTDFEDSVKSFINSEPQERQNVKVAGFSGFICSWEFMSYKHLGIFLKENVGGGIGMIHFVDCQAPINDFEQYKTVFRQIIAGFRK